jgi:hypothetical protein
VVHAQACIRPAATAGDEEMSAQRADVGNSCSSRVKSEVEKSRGREVEESRSREWQCVTAEVCGSRLVLQTNISHVRFGSN